jgi:hypothetical protein
MLWLFEVVHIPAIWATQVLGGLVANGVPSRDAETDAVMAGRTEVVMLYKGPQLAAGVADRLVQRMGEHQVRGPTLRALRTGSATWTGENGTCEGASKNRLCARAKRYSSCRDTSLTVQSSGSSAI